MHLNETQISSISGGLLLIGMGFLFMTGSWWPGMLFLIGIVTIVTYYLKGEGWQGFQGAVWMFGIGIWAITGYNMGILFVIIGASTLLTAVARSNVMSKPYVDNSLE